MEAQNPLWLEQPKVEEHQFIYIFEPVFYKNALAGFLFDCCCKYPIAHTFKGIFLIYYSSTLTIGILKNRYLAHVDRKALSPEAKSFMKQVVQEELMKMQVSGISCTVDILAE